MKTITTSVLLSLLMITSAACSSTSTEDLTSKKDQEIATRKAEVEALAKEYGVNVFINEEVWAQRVPSYEEVESYFESIKKKESGLSVSETTSSIDAPIAKASTSLEYKPARVKRTWESLLEPLSGTLNLSGQCIAGFWVDLTVNWTDGGSLQPDNLSISPDVTHSFNGFYDSSICDLEYIFFGIRGSFTATCTVSCTQGFNNTPTLIDVSIEYEHNMGVGTYSLTRCH